TKEWVESVETVIKEVKIQSKSDYPYFEIINGEIKLKADEPDDTPQEVKDLQEKVRQELPQVDLPELVMEMGQNNEFIKYLTHVNNGKPASEIADIIKNYIVLHSNACNLTETDMERTTGLSRHQFSHHQQWYFTIPSITKINDILVNAIYHHPLTKYWGDGAMSSSDGQKFMVSVRSIHSTVNQKYFFVKKGLNSYTWTADIFAQFGSKLISATEKEATYILDMILDNETELKIEEHTGDEGAYTDVIFAFFDLFGLVFCPRLGSLNKKTLLSITGAMDHAKIKDIFSRPVNFALIERNWSEILRVICSIKSGKVPCSVFVSKLQNTEQKNELLRAFQEYGKLKKTTFIMKYIVDPELRHKIRKQLNKGEGLHDLRQTIFFGNETKIGKPKAREQSLQVWCLTLVTNCVILWNTLYIQKVIDKWKSIGFKFDESLMAYISPCRFEHINKYGKFSFDLDKLTDSIELRESLFKLKG
ncbi:MAG: Tn3 family transposase, partial [Patescibacteria group bacterium]